MTQDRQDENSSMRVRRKSLTIFVVGLLLGVFRFAVYPTVFPGLRIESPLSGAYYMGLTIATGIALLVLANLTSILTTLGRRAWQ